MRGLWIGVALIAVGLSCLSQEPSYEREFADFTRSPNENIINVIQKPFVVRSVRGLIYNSHKVTQRVTEPLPNVLFEIQGPGSDRKIRRTKTDHDGRFRIGHLPPGRYKFKATREDFQSIEGFIVVSREAPKGTEIKLNMYLGV